MGIVEEYELLSDLMRNVGIYAALSATSGPIRHSTLSSTEILAGHLRQKNPDNVDLIDVYINNMLATLRSTVSEDSIQHRICGIVLCQNIQSFDQFMVKLLKKVFTQRSEIFNDKEYKIQMSEVLKCKTIEEVIDRVATRKIHELGYESFEDVISYLNTKLKLNFDVTTEEYFYVCEMFLARNIIVHNDSRINEIYLQRTKRKDLHLGDLYPLAEEDLTDGLGHLINLGLALGGQFVSHFKLH